ncbi:hypothetical protein MBLNU230_g8560t1 [Neophaeotheca triangularis]
MPRTNKKTQTAESINAARRAAEEEFAKQHDKVKDFDSHRARLGKPAYKKAVQKMRQTSMAVYKLEKKTDVEWEVVDDQGKSTTGEGKSEGKKVRFAEGTKDGAEAVVDESDWEKVEEGESDWQMVEGEKES